MDPVGKHGLVEELVSHAAVETIHEAVLHRLARRDVMPLDALLRGKGQDRVAGQRWAVLDGSTVRAGC